MRRVSRRARALSNRARGRLLTDPFELDARLAEGERQAGRRAGVTLERTMAAMGL
jgi:hypothetical protein